MGVSRIMLINTCIEMFAAPLSIWGYSIREHPPVIGDEFWFEKPGLSDQDKYKVIEFQPSGFSSDNLFDMAVNLIKGNLIRDTNNQLGTGNVVGINTDYLIRLSPRIWDKNSTIMDYWWHFNTVDQLNFVCQDILDKLINSGIPFLEDDNKTFEDWLPP